MNLMTRGFSHGQGTGSGKNGGWGVLVFLQNVQLRKKSGGLKERNQQAVFGTWGPWTVV